MRGLFGVVANIAGNTAFKYIPLAKMTVLFYTNPIFIAIFGYLVLKERMTNYDIGGIAATFLGVYIFTMDPFGHGYASQVLEFNSREWWLDILGCSLALIGALGNAGAMLSIRKVGGRTHFLMLALIWALFNSVFSLTLMFANGDSGFQSTSYSWNELRYLILAVLGVAFFQVFTTLAFLTEKPARVAPVGSLQLIINCAFDFFVLHRGEPPQYNQIFGGLVIFCSNVSVSILKCQNVIK